MKIDECSCQFEWEFDSVGSLIDGRVVGVVCDACRSAQRQAHAAARNFGEAFQEGIDMEMAKQRGGVE